MSDNNNQMELSPEKKALVYCAVLFDGAEAGKFLEVYDGIGDELAKLADKLSVVEAELRIPLLGSLLRGSLSALKNE